MLAASPPDRRAEFVALNTFVANGILFGAPLLGAAMANVVGIRPVLFASAALDLAAVWLVFYLPRRARRPPLVA